MVSYEGSLAQFQHHKLALVFLTIRVPMDSFYNPIGVQEITRYNCEPNDPRSSSKVQKGDPFNEPKGARS